MMKNNARSLIKSLTESDNVNLVALGGLFNQQGVEVKVETSLKQIQVDTEPLEISVYKRITSELKNFPGLEFSGAGRDSDDKASLAHAIFVGKVNKSVTALVTVNGVYNPKGSRAYTPKR